MIVLVVLLTLACSTPQPLAESTNENTDSLSMQKNRAESLKKMFSDSAQANVTKLSTNEDGIVAHSYAGSDISPEEQRIVHAQQVARLTKGTAEKPIVDGKSAVLKLVLNGAGSGIAPTSMTVDAPRGGTLKILIVNSATSESTTPSNVSIVKGVNEVPLNLGGLSNGAYTIRVSEGALVASAVFSVAR